MIEFYKAWWSLNEFWIKFFLCENKKEMQRSEDAIHKIIAKERSAQQLRWLFPYAPALQCSRKFKNQCNNQMSYSRMLLLDRSILKKGWKV